MSNMIGMFHDNNDPHNWPELSSNTTTGTAAITNDWEILDDDAVVVVVVNTPDHPVPPVATGNTSTTTTGGSTVLLSNNTSSGFVVVDDDHEDIALESDHLFPPPPPPSTTLTATNYQHLRPSVSSPILSSQAGDTVVVELSKEQSTRIETATNVQDESLFDDSFSMVSDVASVWTTATSTTAVTKTAMTVSFRDAILLSSPHTEHTTNSYRTVAAAAPSSSSLLQKSVGTNATALSQQTVSPRQRSRIQPKFVVVPSVSITTPTRQYRRCSKSTGDLLKLTIPEEFDNVDGSSSSTTTSVTTTHDAYSDHLYDAEEYYCRKSIGATSRMNGQKLRPDEAQRRAMIIYKKDQQRQMNGTKIKNNTSTR